MSDPESQAAWLLATAKELLDLDGLSDATVAALFREFEAVGVKVGAESGRTAFTSWVTRSPLERHAMPADRARAATALRDLYEAQSRAGSQQQQAVLDWFWRAYTTADRRAHALEAENKRLRKLAGADEKGSLPIPRHLRAVHVWSWVEVPTRLQLAAPSGVSPAWVMLYRPQVDSTLIAQLRRLLQTAPHDPCVREVYRQKVEFIW